MGYMKNAKWALITGASSGICLATAKALARENYRLILCGRRADKLESLVKDLQPNNHIVASFDLQNTSEIAKFVTEFEPHLQKLDVLVNNAGLAKGIEKSQNSDLNDWDAMLDTNLRGLLHITRGVVPLMVQKGSGHVVNIGSVAGRWVYPGGAVYCATKFAVRAFTEGLRQDLIGTNIRVSNIEPGMVNSEFSLVRLGSQQKADAVYADMEPLTPEDIADTIIWVLNRPKHVNVQELVIYPTDQAHVGMVHRHNKSQ